MALNEMIARGAQFNVPDPVAQYAKMQQLQAVQNQNALAQYQLGSAQRGDVQQNALYKRLQDPSFSQTNPEHLASLAQFGTPGIAAMKAMTEAANARQTGQKLEGEVRGQQQKEIDAIARNLSQNPTDENILASKNIIQKSSFYNPEAKSKALAVFDQALTIPLTERGSYFGMQGATAGELKPTITPQNLGGTSQLVSTPAFGGKATVVPGSVGSNTMTPYQSGALNVSQQQLGVAQGNLKVAQQRLAKEGTNLDPAENAAISTAIIEGRLDPNRVNGRNAKILATTLLANPSANLLELGVSASGATAAERSLATQTAKMSTAANEANKMVDVVRDLSGKVNRTEFPTINAISNAVSKGTGGTEIVQLNASINALVNSYARAISPTGQPTVSDKNHAREVINSAYSTGQIDAILDVMQQEMSIARKAAGTASTELRESRELARGRGSENAKPAEPGRPAATLAPADKQALDWANANPRDPRALQIKQRLGQ